MGIVAEVACGTRGSASMGMPLMFSGLLVAVPTTFFTIIARKVANQFDVEKLHFDISVPTQIKNVSSKSLQSRHPFVGHFYVMVRRTVDSANARGSIAELVKSIAEEFGGLDVLVNRAGTAQQNTETCHFTSRLQHAVQCNKIVNNRT
jgi:hypothetical protein